MDISGCEHSWVQTFPVDAVIFKMPRHFYPKLDNTKTSASFYAKNITEFPNLLVDRYQVKLNDVITVEWQEESETTLITLSANDKTLQFIKDNDPVTTQIQPQPHPP